MSDDLITCPRCKNADAVVGELCFGCQWELEAHHDHEIGWREAHQRELDDELRQNIADDPNYVKMTLDIFDEFEVMWRNDGQSVDAIERQRAAFLARVERVTGKSPS